jgi:hypothetical protein
VARADPWRQLVAFHKEAEMRFVTLLVAGALIGTPLAAQSSPTGPIDRGSMLVAGSVFLSHTDGDGGTSSSATTFNVQPNVLYFVVPRVAVGGQAGFGYTTFDGGHASQWNVGPAARIFFGAVTARVLPFVGASIQRGRSASTTDQPIAARSESTFWGVEGVGGATFMFSRQVGLAAEAFVRHDANTFERTQLPETKSDRNQYGFRVGIAAFAF